MAFCEEAYRTWMPPDCCAPNKECIRVEAQMNSIFSRYRKVGPEPCSRMAQAVIFVGIVILGAAPFAAWLHAQTGSGPTAEFNRISGELSAARLSGGAESEGQMEKALAYLDVIAVTSLNIPSGPSLDGANRGLAALASHTPPAYAMVANFGLGGPAAVRIYAGSAGTYALAARIDRFIQKDFFDSDLELVPASNSEPVFVTVGGRTDDLSTGMFSAWRFDGHRALNLWNSDLLQQSSYEVDENGLRLAYCLPGGWGCSS